MNQPSPPAPDMPPPGHPLAHQVVAWLRLRDELLALNAQLVTLQLMLRLQRRGEP